MRTVGYLSFLPWLVLRLLVCASPDLHAETVTVEDASPSLFFGEGPAKPSYHYDHFAKQSTLYTHLFDRDRWNEKAPLPRNTGEDVVLSRQSAEMLLLRFQKPGGFTTRSLSEAVMRAILNSRIYDESPLLIAGAMQNILATSPSTYDRLVADFPKLNTLQMGKQLTPFRNREEASVVRKAVLKYFFKEEARLAPDRPTEGPVLHDWTNMMPLSAVLATLPDGSANDDFDTAAEPMAVRAGNNEYKGVFISMLLDPIIEALNPVFGDKNHPQVKFQAVPRGKKLVPIVISTRPVEGFTKTPDHYGLYKAELKPIPLKKPGDEVSIPYRWKSDGKTFESVVKAKQVKGPMLPADYKKGPRYDELWADGVLNGLVLIGANLEGDAQSVARAYLTYFRKEGFSGTTKPRTIQDTEKFIKNEIVSGTTDWAVKEAHSHADLRDVVGVKGDSDLYVMRSPDGKEVVKLVMPKPHPRKRSKDEFILDREFGRWMAQRYERTPNQLVLLNTSCWAESLVNRIQAEVADREEGRKYSNLFEIGTTTATDYFRNYSNDAERIVVDGIRHGMSPAQIKSKLKKLDKDYKMKTADRIIFPGDPENADYVSPYLIEEGPVHVVDRDVAPAKPKGRGNCAATRGRIATK